LVAPISKAIATWARRNHRVRGEEQAYANLWVAREMLGKKCRIQDAAELAGYMSGVTPLDTSTVRRKLNGLDKELAAVE